MRLNYIEINSRALNLILSVNNHVSSIDNKLKALIELRVSQINGCSFCIDLHCNEARNAGENQQRLDCLSVWKDCELFTDREKVVLGWAESVTHKSHDGESLTAISESKNGREI